MKRTIEFLFAVMVIISSASCTKDEQLNINERSEARVIELTFDNSDASKVGVSDRTPQWQAGDKIWITNGTDTPVEVTLTAADIAGNRATITTTLEGTLYAVYPASANNGVSGEGEARQIGFKIPTTTDGSFGNAHISVAQGMDALTFKNVVSILKFDVGADTLINVSSSANIAGEFKVKYGETLSIEAGTDQAKNIMVSASADRDKYIAVASGVAFSAFEFTAIKTATDWAYKKSTSSTQTAVNTIYPLGKVSGWSYVTNGSLWAKFSVGASSQVRFSKGNMYCNTTVTPVIFSFEENQYDTESTWNASHVSYYFWSKTASATYTQSFTASEPSSSDIFFTNATATTPKSDFTVNEETGVWRMLTQDEWRYLMDNRTDAESKVGYATVAGMHGMIVLPDTFTDPMKNNGSGSFVPKSTTDWTANVYTAGDNWNVMEAAGALFIPAAGSWWHYSVPSYNIRCFCWSSDGPYRIYVDNATAIAVDDDTVYAGDGYSVRLVTAAQ